jgi:hypothetical protein
MESQSDRRRTVKDVRRKNCDNEVEEIWEEE